MGLGPVGLTRPAPVRIVSIGPRIANHSAPRGRRLEAARVLVVEDDPTMAAAIGELLTERGHVPSHAASGAEAKALLGREHPDLILLDLVLPDVDGLFLFLEIRERCDAPVIVCSATSRKRDVLMALKLGVHDF